MNITIDVGVVIYSISSKNIINARWYSTGLAGDLPGTGIARGDTSNGFEGTYEITYFTSDGIVIGVYTLDIVRENEIFRLFWRKDNNIFFVGVGVLSQGELSVGWRKANE